MVLPLLLFLPFIVATEPFVYVYPVNPKLHPRNLYPIQRSLRGFEKVRDLPRSGIVYLNRIKPISEEFKGVIVHGNSTFVKSEIPGPLAQLQARNNDTLDKDTDNRRFTNMTSIAFDDVVVVDETLAERSTSTPPPMRTTIASDPTLISTVIPLPSTKSVKNLLKISMAKSSKKEEADSSEEARPNLMHLVNYIRTKNKVNFIEKDPKVETIKMPKNIQAHGVAETLHHGGMHKAKLVSLNRTATLHTGAVTRKANKEKSVQSTKRKSYGRVGGTTAHRASEFDPWERIGTL